MPIVAEHIAREVGRIDPFELLGLPRSHAHDLAEADPEAGGTARLFEARLGHFTLVFFNGVSRSESFVV